MNERYTDNQQALFNAGVDIALEISKYVKVMAYYSQQGDYSNWLKYLEIIERRMHPKIRKKKECDEEINKIKNKYKEQMDSYLRKVARNKKIPYLLMVSIKDFLVEYEKSLLYWRDVFGYGMPDKDDPRFKV